MLVFTIPICYCSMMVLPCSIKIVLMDVKLLLGGEKHCHCETLGKNIFLAACCSFAVVLSGNLSMAKDV